MPANIKLVMAVPPTSIPVSAPVNDAPESFAPKKPFPAHFKNVVVPKVSAACPAVIAPKPVGASVPGSAIFVARKFFHTFDQYSNPKGSKKFIGLFWT